MPRLTRRLIEPPYNLGHGEPVEVITKGIKTLCAQAEAEIETWSVEQTYAHYEDDGVVLIDIRDIRELWRDGAIPGAVHAPRGMLEFWIDPASPYARDVF